MTSRLTREEMQELISALRLTPTSTVNGISLGRLADALSENEAAMDSEPDYDIHRDANRYRFLRDKDAFGDEGSPGLAGWDDLAELDMGEFDSAVDARILSCEMPQPILTKAHERTGTAGVYAELYRLREEVKGPDGFDTWKDAAIAERKARVEIEKASQRVVNIDYLGAMAAFHSDQWHKMGPINGYMHGWNACRAAMLQADNDVTNGKPLTITLPDITSRAFWSGTGKSETFHPESYKRWVKETIERDCIIARIDVEVK